MRVLADTQGVVVCSIDRLTIPYSLFTPIRVVVGGAKALRRAFRDRRGETGVLEAGDGQTSGESDDGEHSAHESVIGCWRRRERAPRYARCPAGPAGRSRPPNRDAPLLPPPPRPPARSRFPPRGAAGAEQPCGVGDEPPHHVEAVGAGIERRRRLVAGNVGCDVRTAVGHVRRVRHHDVDGPARRERGEQNPPRPARRDRRRRAGARCAGRRRARPAIDRRRRWRRRAC